MITVECKNLLNKLDKAIKDTTDLKGNMEDYLRDMHSVGLEQVKRDYNSAVDFEGNPAKGDVNFVEDPKITPNGFELEAFGKDIAFLEFGTGIFQTETHPLGAQMGMTPKSYSAINKQFLFGKKLDHFGGRWPHDGTLHSGQNPSKGMYNASKAMQDFVANNPIGIFK